MSAPHLKKLRENDGILTFLIVIFILIIINSFILLFYLRGTPAQESAASGQPAVSEEVVDSEPVDEAGRSVQDNEPQESTAETDAAEADVPPEDSDSPESVAQADSGDAQTSDPDSAAASEEESSTGEASSTDEAATEGETAEGDSTAEDSGEGASSTEETTEGESAESDAADGETAEAESAAEFSSADEAETGNDAEDVLIPSLNALDVDQIMAGEQVSFSGSGEPGSEILIQANGNTLESTLVNDDGDWSFTASFDEPGDYSIQASTMDPVQASEPVLLSVMQPEIEPPVIEVAGTGQILADETFALSGTGEPGSTVAVVVNGEVVDNVTVDDDGTWTYNFTINTPGEYDIAVNALDDNGNVLAESNTMSLLVEKALTAATLDALAIDETTAGTPVEFSGSGEPGGTVALATNGETLDEITVDDDGTWRYASTFNSPGDYDIQVYTLDEAGNVQAESDAQSLVVAEAVPLTLDELATDEAITDETINLSGTANPGSEVQIIAGDELFGVAEVKPDGTWLFAIAFSNSGSYEVLAQVVDADGNVTETTQAAEVSVLPRPSSENFDFIFPADGGEIIIGRLTIIGTGEPGLELEVLDNSALLGATQIEDNGEWSFSLEPDFGNHAFSARLVDVDSAIGPLNLTVVGADDVVCDSNLGIGRGDSYIVGTCNTFGTVIERTGVDLEDLISVNPQIQNPDLIYPGDIINIP